MRKTYSVEEAIWLAAALFAYEKYITKSEVQVADVYLEAPELQKIAQGFTDKTIQSARIHQHNNGDHNNCTHRSLRRLEKYAGHPVFRVTATGEFNGDREYPSSIAIEDEIIFNNKKYSINEIKEFLDNDYVELVKEGTNVGENTMSIDYLGILKYLENNREVPYKDPTKPGLSDEEKEGYLEVKRKGQQVVAELKKVHEVCSKKFNLEKCEKVSWDDGSHTKTKSYLWVPMKYMEYAERQESISVFVELADERNAGYRVSLELRNDKATADDVQTYHKHLELPLNEEAALIYVAGSNEWGRPDKLDEDQNIIIEKVKRKEYNKVQICRRIEKSEFSTNDKIQEEILKSIEALIPYYQYVLGMKKEEYWPSLDEYRPGITSEQWTEFLQEDAIEYPSTLVMLKSMLEMGGQATCKDLALKLGETTSACISRGSNLGKRAKKRFGLPDYIEDDGTVRHFVTCFVGKRVDGNLYAWKLRDELKEALESMDLSGISTNMIKKHAVEFDKNIILYGPPGTGKTYKSAIYAVAICDGKTLEELTDYDEVMARYEELKTEKRIAFTTFHQSYGYEEFIEGIRPIMKSNTNELRYAIEPGVFKAFCEDAKNPKIDQGIEDDETNSKNYVFIIDEINRGNISKIFGELITLIETTKRAGMPEAASVILPYSRESFSVPSNVYILGTMNTADRSIQLMDTALRRRFSFIEMMPEVKVLEKLCIDEIDIDGTTLNIAKMLDAINERISFLFDREHTIGHAFFTGLRDEPTIEKLSSIFKNSVIPLMQEYFYEDYQKIQLVLGDNAKEDPNTKFVLDKKIELRNLFMGNVEDVVDEKEVKYEINVDAFNNIESYKLIAKGL